ncbi:MAG: photosystem II assembly protein Psb35 [Almyronema sp.]
MNLFVLAVAEGAGGFPLTFTLVYVVGFVAAVSIGSIAWYNSKRPAGWEGKDRPDFIPKVKEDASDDGSSN